MLRKFSLILSLIIFLSLSGQIHAFKPETFITFANPVRGSEGWQTPGQDPLELPLFQYQESTHSGIPNTWLLRYDAVTDATISAFFADLQEIDKSQTLGSFLEITPGLTEAAQVVYPPGTLFFNANRIFLSGYSIGDRRKLIDTYMSAFFDKFGFYPGSVSAWHLDSYSLQYLQEKYSVLTAMNCDDQYSTDHYRLWGGYLGSPYFPDKNNSLVPAGTFDNRVNLAMVRWAQRDLFNFYGYKSESAYSVQVNDYLAMGQDTKYFENLLKLYEQKNFNEFTYLNIGLENDYYLPNYKDEIRKVYQVLRDNRDKYNLRYSSLNDFGDWFKARYPESSPAYFYQTADPTGKNPGKVFWYQSPHYRIGLKSAEGKTEIIDFRVYNRRVYEDYYATPNQNLDLFHEIPAVIDSVKFPGTAVGIGLDLEKANFIYDTESDSYVCPEGQTLKFQGIKHDRKGQPVRRYRAVASVCRACPLFGTCTKNYRHGRTLEVGPHDDALRRQRARMATEAAQATYSLRKQVIEPIFGVVKEQLDGRRFLLRGQENVDAEWNLLSVAFNLRTLARVWRTRFA